MARVAQLNARRTRHSSRDGPGQLTASDWRPPFRPGSRRGWAPGCRSGEARLVPSRTPRSGAFPDRQDAADGGPRRERHGRAVPGTLTTPPPASAPGGLRSPRSRRARCSAVGPAITWPAPASPPSHGEAEARAPTEHSACRSAGQPWRDHEELSGQPTPRRAQGDARGADGYGCRQSTLRMYRRSAREPDDLGLDLAAGAKDRHRWLRLETGLGG